MLLNFLSSLRPMFRDQEICLVLSPEDVRDPDLGISDGYTFDIFLNRPRRRIGYVSLRLGESPALYYLGHIGYRIDAAYRGHGYAAKACRLIIPFMRELQLKSVCITANPENTPSRKTCEQIGCTLESIAAVPAAYRTVCAGAEYKCRYILPLQEEA
ncbi:MAG: GNAT family N-acetyltransferase [Clostridia bacterium]|nr:GNAT family N-acetyltransferase [Clostridia bacterium]